MQKGVVILALIVSLAGCSCADRRSRGALAAREAYDTKASVAHQEFASRPLTSRLCAESKGILSSDNLALLAAVTAGSLAVGRLVDEPVADYFEDHKPARGLEAVGDVAGYALPVGLIACTAIRGISGDEEMARLSKALTEAGVLTLLYGETLVTAFGRERPRGDKGPHHYEPFGYPGNRAFPMIHPSIVNAQLKVLSRFYPENKLFGIGRYLIAGSIAYFRIEKGSHWLSDVPLGIALSEIIGGEVADRYLAGGKKKNWAIRPYLEQGAQGFALSVRF